MWALVPSRTRVQLILVLALALGCASYLARGESGGSSESFPILEFSQYVLSAVPLVLIIGWALGKWRWAWSWPCRRLGLRLWYPDLNGVWEGELKSTFRAPSRDGSVVIRMRIEQRWSGVTVSTVGRGPRGSSSDTVLAAPRREDERFVLWQVFRGESLDRLPTDEQVFYGTSRLTYDPVTQTIRGAHWTNRAAQHQLNTAGSFELRRISSDPQANPPSEGPGG